MHMPKRPKICFLISEYWYFVSHRLPLARACRDMGWDVVVGTRIEPGTVVEEPGIRVVPIDFHRSGRVPLHELRTLLAIRRLLIREAPDVLHTVALKPVLYGGTAARLAGVRNLISAMAGMGYVFTSASPRIQLIRRILIHWMRLVLRRRRSWLILQNTDDVSMMVNGGVIDAEQVHLIRGSGVDLERFHPSDEPEGPPVFAIVSRMLTDKGVREIVWAARELRRRGVEAKVWLVGAPDHDNPTSLSETDLKAWNAEGCIEWLGPRDNIPEVWRRAHVCVLPSYREGVAKAMLEAAACGRPIITTDVPGCREVVRDGIDGFVVPCRDWHHLADAMEILATDAQRRRAMGRAARERAEREFGLEGVVQSTLDLYRRALESPA